MNKRKKRILRHHRVRAKIRGTKDMPRVAVFRSNRYITGQIIDDVTQKTLLSISNAPSKGVKQIKTKMTKVESSAILGEELAKKAKLAGIEKVTFDRGGYKYHGRVKAFADGLRKGGLIL